MAVNINTAPLLHVRFENAGKILYLIVIAITSIKNHNFSNINFQILTADS